MKNINSSIIVLIPALVFGIGGIFVWQYLQNSESVEPVTNQEENGNPIVPEKEEKPSDFNEQIAGWKDYENKLFGFGLKLPAILAYEYDSVFEPTDTSKKKVLTLPLGKEPFQVWLTINAPGSLPTTTENNLLGKSLINIEGAEQTIKNFRQRGLLISSLSFIKDDQLFSIWAEINGQEEERLRIFKNLLFTLHF